MVVVAVLNQKGGVGKTTLATNLTRALHLEGAKVLLVDSDPQGSARDWHAAGDGKLVNVVGLDRPTLDRDLKAVESGYDWLIIDGAPQAHNLTVAAIKAANVILIPVQPSPYDIWGTSDVVDLVKQRQEVTEGRPRATFVVSRRIQGTKIGDEIRTALAAYELPVFEAGTTQRVIYANSAATGTTVLDAEPNGPAAEEVRAITQELKEFANGAQRRQTKSKATAQNARVVERGG
jgi:chromosome partitioning protein